ncbi:MAG: hypothetical protein ACM31O_10215 [Bacteroidota bacterium]
MAAAAPLPSVLESTFERPPSFILAQGQSRPVLNVSKIILAEPASETPLPIQVGPPDAIARNSFIRIRGLPPAAALTEGHSIAPGAWAIPIISLPNLKITVPVGQSGKSDVTIALVTVDGNVVAEAKTALVVAAAALIAPTENEPESKNVASLGPTSSPPPTERSRDPLSNTIPTPPPQQTEEQKRAAALRSKGDDQLGQGNIASARLFYERAAEAGDAPAALALAATYDPEELDRLGARSVQPDPALARRWYERARQLGAAEAEEKLKRLGAR